MGKYPSKVVLNHYGKALIAKKTIPAGTVVEKFEGKVISYNEVPLDMICYAIYVGENGADEWVVSKTNAIYANHSCEPNCSIDDELNIFTTKEVKKGEELSYSYNRLEEDENEKDYIWDKRWNFECKCGSPVCQKNVNGYVKKKKEVEYAKITTRLNDRLH